MIKKSTTLPPIAEILKKNEPEIEKYSKQLCRRYFGQRNNKISHEDVKQQALLKLYDQLLKGELDISLTSDQLWVITRSVFLDMWKRESAQKRSGFECSIDDNDEVSKMETPKLIITAFFVEYIDVINRLVAKGEIKLQESQMEILNCFKIGYITPAEIAKVLGISAKSASNRKRNLGRILHVQAPPAKLESLRFKLYGNPNDSDLA